MIEKVIEINRDLVTLKLRENDVEEVVHISEFVSKLNKQLK